MYGICSVCRETHRTTATHAMRVHGPRYHRCAGSGLAPLLICHKCGEELDGDACTNPTCDNWRFAAQFDKIAPR